MSTDELDLLACVTPEFAAVLDTLPDLDLSDITRARRERRAFALQTIERFSPTAGVEVSDHFVTSHDGTHRVRIRVYRPVERGTSLPCFYWIHGGGHVLGLLEQDDPLLHRIVLENQCVAVSVDWRQAPEHPYPAEIEDCYVGLCWTARSAEMLGIDRKRIVVAGASSGGGSAAGLALLARDRGEVSIAFQILIYPMLDDRNITASSFAITDPRVWNREKNELAWRAYLGELYGSDEVPYYAAPARARDLSKLPDTYIATGDLDLFLDEDLDYASRLARAGVATELRLYPRAVHGFDLFAPDMDVSKRFVRDTDEVIRRALHHARS